jgi:hypothetical protein
MYERVCIYTHDQFHLYADINESVRYLLPLETLTAMYGMLVTEEEESPITSPAKDPEM